MTYDEVAQMPRLLKKKNVKIEEEVI